MVIFICIAVFYTVMLCKLFVTTDNRLIIIEAIAKYKSDACAYEEFEWTVDWSDMESYDKTLWRLWDWGYKRILPKEKFEFIKDYINKEKNNDQT